MIRTNLYRFSADLFFLNIFICTWLNPHIRNPQVQRLACVSNQRTLNCGNLNMETVQQMGKSNFVLVKRCMVLKP
jgi:hypothetical protein